MTYCQCSVKGGAVVIVGGSAPAMPTLGISRQARAGTQLSWFPELYGTVSWLCAVSFAPRL